jgi:hypothetical protein
VCNCVDLFERVYGDVCIYLRRLQAGVAEQGLDETDVRPALQHVGRAGVTKDVGRARLVDAREALIAGVFEGFELRGLSQRQMVAELNALGVRAPRGGTWRLKQMQRVVGRIEQHVIGRLIAGD